MNPNAFSLDDDDDRPTRTRTAPRTRSNPPPNPVAVFLLNWSAHWFSTFTATFLALVVFALVARYYVATKITEAMEKVQERRATR